MKDGKIESFNELMDKVEDRKMNCDVDMCRLFNVKGANWCVLGHQPDECSFRKKILKAQTAPVVGYEASLERPTWKVKIKGDAGEYEIWAIDWLNQKALVYRACGDEWVQLSKLVIATQRKN